MSASACNVGHVALTFPPVGAVQLAVLASAETIKSIRLCPIMRVASTTHCPRGSLSVNVPASCAAQSKNAMFHLPRACINGEVFIFHIGSRSKWFAAACDSSRRPFLHFIHGAGVERRGQVRPFLDVFCLCFCLFARVVVLPCPISRILSRVKILSLQAP